MLYVYVWYIYLHRVKHDHIYQAIAARAGLAKYAIRESRVRKQHCQPRINELVWPGSAKQCNQTAEIKDLYDSAPLG